MASCYIEQGSYSYSDRMWQNWLLSIHLINLRASETSEMSYSQWLTPLQLWHWYPILDFSIIDFTRFLHLSEVVMSSLLGTNCPANSSVINLFLNHANVTAVSPWIMQSKRRYRPPKIPGIETTISEAPHLTVIASRDGSYTCPRATITLSPAVISGTLTRSVCSYNPPRTKAYTYVTCGCVR